MIIFLFKNGNYDLAMILLGEGKTRFNVIQCKLLLSRLGGYLDRRCFIRAVFLIRLFTAQGIVSREIGAKEQHLHLHVVFHLLFSDKKSHVDKLKGL